METVRTIVVGIDFSELSRVAFEAGVALVERLGAERLHLVHVLNEHTSVAYAFPDAEAVETNQVKRLEEKLAELHAPGVEVTREVLRGIPARDIARAAKAAGGDLIIVASQGYGAIRRALLGSVAASLVRTSEVPVLIVGAARKHVAFEDVMAAVDLSPIGDRIVAAAKRFAADGRVHIVSAVEPPPFVSEALPGHFGAVEQARLRTAQLERLQSHGDVEIIDGPSPAEAILTAATQAGVDLLVIGTSGHSAWHRMFVGSTATHVLADATCPVLVIPYAGEA
ncbi:MAG: universal stress protein [Deltaproteobacteria bacterium]|jgi:nucleotide-binding universal stress UspA family protein